MEVDILLDAAFGAIRTESSSYSKAYQWHLIDVGVRVADGPQRSAREEPSIDRPVTFVRMPAVDEMSQMRIEITDT